MILLDTHVLVWWVDGERKKLSPKAAQALRQHSKRNELLVSSISFFEIATLERRGRLRFSMPAAAWLANVRRLPEYRLEPLTDDIAERAGQFGDAFPGDPADRLMRRPRSSGMRRSSPTMTGCARFNLCKPSGEFDCRPFEPPSACRGR